MSDRRQLPDLFQDFFDNRLIQLENDIQTAANSDRLRIERGHLASMNLLLGSFKGQSDDILRAVHRLEDNEFFIGFYAREYFYKTFQLIGQRKLKAIKRLIIYEADSELRDPLSIELMRFHAVTRGYEYRAISATMYANYALSTHIDIGRDFGIYGNKYVYISQVNQIDHVIGHWSRRPTTVSDFTDFFDQCWKSQHAIKIPHVPTTGEMTVDELYTVPISSK
jgi:hypothetical protein